MALGGGTFTTQSKLLPGAYINFISASRASSALADRGYAALPLELDWGPENEIFTVEFSDFKKDSMKYFGYDYGNTKIKGLRDLFRNIRTGYFYRLNSGGVKAENTYATALHCGTRGNALKVVIEANPISTGSDKVYDVGTFIDTVKVDSQTVRTMAELQQNDYLVFKKTATIALTAGTPLSGGSNGSSTNASYQAFLDKLESYSFNTLGCLSADPTVKALFVAYTKRMRDTVGSKFQCVLHQFSSANHEGIISVENNTAPDLVYWVTGAEAGCSLNQSNTNKIYDGEFSVNAGYTQTQLEEGLAAGKLMLHKVGDSVRILEDINTLLSYTDEKGSDFTSNQTIRVLDQIGNDIASLFNDKYLGKVPNDNAGRISLWNDIVRHHQELQNIRAIENFDPAKLTIEQGSGKKSVAVTNHVTPINAMAQLYMTVVVQ